MVQGTVKSHYLPTPSQTLGLYGNPDSLNTRHQTISSFKEKTKYIYLSFSSPALSLTQTESAKYKTLHLTKQAFILDIGPKIILSFLSPDFLQYTVSLEF